MRIPLQIVERPNGVILYKGPSLINSKPIVCIAVNLQNASDNRKTGDFIQTYILADNGKRPTDNLNSGEDDSVCGDCVHREWKTCYVNLGMAPNGIFRAYSAGKYPLFNSVIHLDLFRNRLIRLGSYGNPSSCSYESWQEILEVSSGHTSYIHNWKTCDQRYKTISMASVESVKGMLKAKEMGWKTFRVRNSDELIQLGEFICPASVEAGKRLKCETCLACKGGEFGKQATPAIISHGLDWKSSRFNRMQKLMVQKKKFRNVSKEVLNGLAF